MLRWKTEKVPSDVVLCTEKVGHSAFCVCEGTVMVVSIDKKQKQQAGESPAVIDIQKHDLRSTHAFAAIMTAVMTTTVPTSRRRHTSMDPCVSLVFTNFM